MIKTQRVLLVPEDTHYEYPGEVSASTNSTAKKFSKLTYGQLILCLAMSSKHEFQVFLFFGKRDFLFIEGIGIKRNEKKKKKKLANTHCIAH